MELSNLDTRQAVAVLIDLEQELTKTAQIEASWAAHWEQSGQADLARQTRLVQGSAATRAAALGTVLARLN